jgi:hypothetical protein
VCVCADCSNIVILAASIVILESFVFVRHSSSSSFLSFSLFLF